MPPLPNSENDSAPVPVKLNQRLVIYVYVGILFLALPLLGVWKTSALFALKDHLHMAADEVAFFLLFVNIPAYFGFVFGFLRDRWSPFKKGDQGLLVLFCLITFGLFVVAAAGRTSFALLGTVFVLTSIFGQFLSAALQGLTSIIGQEHLMTGRLSSVWQAAGSIPGLFVSLLAAWIADKFSIGVAFSISALIALAICLFACWRPKQVYDKGVVESIAPSRLASDVREIAKTKELWPVLTLLFIWNFTPGVGTPIQYYLTDVLRGTKSQYGEFNAIFNGFFIPTLLLYGYLCSRMKPRPLIWICTFIAVPQILPLLIVHSANSAMIAAVPMGLMGGLATAAYFDLLIRACPKGLHGTVMMMGASVWTLSGELGNLAGSKLFSAFGSFAPCAWATAIVYSLLIPVFACVPKHLTRQRDGEVLPVPA